jgi:dihydroflavonol-4-reductase
MKTVSERAAWEYMETHQNEPLHFTLSAILPTFVFGPVPSGDVGSSTRVLQHLLSGQDPGLGNMYCALVNVRDVVEAHIRASTISEAADKRFLLTQMEGAKAFVPEIAAVLREAFGPMGYKITSWILPRWTVWLPLLVDPEVASIYSEVERVHLYDNSQLDKYSSSTTSPPIKHGSMRCIL